jgi:hypothetical protein
VSASDERPPRFGNVLSVEWLRQTPKESRVLRVSLGWGLVLLVLAMLGCHREVISVLLSWLRG